MIKKDFILTGVIFAATFAFMALVFAWFFSFSWKITLFMAFDAIIAGFVLGYIYPRGRNQNPEDIQ